MGGCFIRVKGPISHMRISSNEVETEPLVCHDRKERGCSATRALFALKINHQNQLYAHDYTKPRSAQKRFQNRLDALDPKYLRSILGLRRMKPAEMGLPLAEILVLLCAYRVSGYRHLKAFWVGKPSWRALHRVCELCKMGKEVLGAAGDVSGGLAGHHARKCERSAADQGRDAGRAKRAGLCRPGYLSEELYWKMMEQNLLLVARPLDGMEHATEWSFEQVRNWEVRQKKITRSGRLWRGGLAGPRASLGCRSKGCATRNWPGPHLFGLPADAMGGFGLAAHRADPLMINPS